MSGNSTKCESLADVMVPNYGISEGQNATVSKETFRISGWVTDTRGISKITYKINGGTENDFSLEQKTGVAFTSQINTVNCKAGSNTVDITVYPKTGNTYKLPTLKVTVAIQPFVGEIEAPETDTINSGDNTGENFAEANFTAVIKNAGSGKVLTVRESDSNVLSNSASGTPAQTWKFIKKTSTSYAIQNTATVKYLYSTGKSGDNVAVKDASGDTIPKWELYKAKSGGYYLKPMASSSSMLDLTDGSTAEDANIRIYQYNAGNAQRFTLEYQVESVALNKTSAVLTEKGQTVQLTASVLPNQAKDKTVTWTSSDLSVATVNSSGLVTAVGNGAATITVKTNNSAKTAVCKVTVDIPTAVAKGEITAGSVAGKPGQTVEVPITLTKNPGIIAVQFHLKYDSSKLQLIEIKDTGLLESPQMNGNYTANPYILAWGDGMLENNITKTGKVGDTVTVAIKLSDLSELSAIVIKINYDNSKLQLLSIEDTGFLTGYDPDTTVDITSVPYSLSWGSGLSVCNSGSSGEIAKLNFKILPTFTEGTENINATVYDACDMDMNDVPFQNSTAVGTITLDTPVHEHTFGEWTTTKEPSCTEKGEKKRICSSCEYEETEEIEMTEHIPGEWETVKEPTCTESGSKNQSCTSCGKVPQEKSVDSLGHDGQWTVTKEATCTTPGLKKEICSRCNEVLSEQEISIISHIPGEWEIVKEATCTEEGKKVQKCTSCETIISEQMIQAKGHTYGAWTVTKEATILEDGEEKRTCSVCGNVEKRRIPQIVHEEKDHVFNGKEIVVKDASCTETGLKQVYCSVDLCTAYKEIVIPAKGHNSGEWETEKEPSCTEYGKRVKKCTVCHEVIETEVIPMIVHSYGEWKVEKAALFVKRFLKHVCWKKQSTSTGNGT